VAGVGYWLKANCALIKYNSANFRQNLPLG